MKKIPTIYQRDPATNLRHVMNERHPDCEWVFNGEGVATYKWDGTAVMISGTGVVWQRREVKPGKPLPDSFRQEGDEDPNTGKRVGWVVADLTDRANRWLAEAAENAADLPSGTYELIGPKIQGNPHGWEHHQLIPHENAGGRVFEDDGIGDHFWQPPPVEFEALGEWLHGFANNGSRGAVGFEGIVWHHPDGRMAKIKLRDFPTPEAATA